MGRFLEILGRPPALVTVSLVLSAFGAGVVPGSSALAQGTGTSAGDQQYVDPLSGSTGTSTAHPSTTPATSSPSGSGPSSSRAAAGAASSASGSGVTPSSASASATPTSSSTTPTSTSAAGATASTASSQNSSSGTLPFTGLNVETFVVAGVGLLGAGLLLRWIVTRT